MNLINVCLAQCVGIELKIIIIIMDILPLLLLCRLKNKNLDPEKSHKNIAPHQMLDKHFEAIIPSGILVELASTTDKHPATTTD